MIQFVCELKTLTHEMKLQIVHTCMFLLYVVSQSRGGVTKRNVSQSYARRDSTVVGGWPYPVTTDAPNDWSRMLQTPAWKSVVSVSKVDIIFLVDGSGSVSEKGIWKRILSWIVDMAAQLDISNEAVQIGVVQYSHKLINVPLKGQTYLRTELPLGRCKTLNCFSEHVSRIKILPYTTYTGAAINKTIKEDFQQSNRSANRVLILLTDGPSQDDVTYASHFARKNNVISFCIGIDKYKLSELQMIANGEYGNSLRVYQPRSYHTLATLIPSLSNEIKATFSIPVCPPLLTPYHGTLACSNSNNVGSNCTYVCDASYNTRRQTVQRTCLLFPDIGPHWSGTKVTCGFCSTKFDMLFILDSSSSIGERNFRVMKDFVIRLIDTFDISEHGVQVSAIRYNREVTSLWNYNDYKSKDALMQAVSNIQYSGSGTKTGDALRHAIDIKFGANSGRRKGISHLTVVLTDGKSHDNVRGPAEQLQRKSKVIAIGVNSLGSDQIDTIASDPDRLYSHTVNNFVALLSILPDVARNICNAQSSLANTTCSPALLPNPSNCRQALKCSDSNRVDSICRAQCCPGFHIPSGHESSCNYDGNWSKTTWQCVRKVCHPIPRTPGLVLTCDADNDVGSRCNISCKSGFRISADAAWRNCDTYVLGYYTRCSYECLNHSRIRWDNIPATCLEFRPCASNPCENGGNCSNLRDEFKCDCPRGFTGKACNRDIDECHSNPCRNNALCLNLIDDYKCACKPGYTGKSCDIKIDNCRRAKCNNGTCRDLITKFECICNAGFSGKYCEHAIDWCLRNECVRGNCVNSVKNYSCSCPDGYSGIYCEIDPCTNNPCVNGLCFLESPGKFSCYCQPGFTGALCNNDVVECASNPCQNGGTCNHLRTPNVYNCTCLSGYHGLNCEMDVDECRNNICQNNASCSNTIGGFICDCQPGFTGSFCEFNIDECVSQPCLNNATCSDDLHGYSCTCLTGFTGLQCEMDLDECVSSPCLNHATCDNNHGFFTCSCAIGYEGKLCEKKINHCADVSCGDNGECVNLTTGYRCDCNVEFEGDLCQNRITGCGSKPCKNDGICHNTNDTFTCLCPTGWYGNTCEKINECVPDPCQNNGTCNKSEGGFSCTCVPGLTGKTCESRLDQCDGFPCGTHGECIPTTTGFSCACHEGYSGTNCQIGINECSLEPCKNGGSCKDGNGSFSCVCLDGWKGDLCETDINECLARPCENSGICQNTPGSYKCLCVAGFGGIYCQNRIGTCRPGLCQNGGACENVSNGYMCRCVDGYTGENCQTVTDSCISNPCANGGTCLDAQNSSYHCECAYGYGGIHCENVTDHCLIGGAVKCFNKGTCQHESNGYTCLCPEGYLGPDCQQKQCHQIPERISGQILCNSTDRRPGTICNLKCTDATVPLSNVSGSNLKTCLPSGLWEPNSDLDWGCKVPRCPAFQRTITYLPHHSGLRSLTVNGSNDVLHPNSEPKISFEDAHYARCDGFEVGSQCTFQCKPGFALQDYATNKCMAGGKWSRQPPKCKMIECPKIYPSSVVRGQWFQCSGNKTGSYCLLFCPEGFLVNRVCEEGRWIPQGRWECDHKCTVPPYRVFNGSYHCTKGFSLGSKCTNHCEIGFIETKLGSYTCQMSNREVIWRGTYGNCAQCKQWLDLKSGVSSGFIGESVTLQWKNETSNKNCNREAILSIQPETSHNISVALKLSEDTLNTRIDISFHNATREISSIWNASNYWIRVEGERLRYRNAQTEFEGKFPATKLMRIQLRRSYLHIWDSVKKTWIWHYGPIPHGYALTIGLNSMENQRTSSGVCKACIRN